ncbi:MAG TPA: adenylate/guanylate cyclase domain-containing protein [Usitatibacter sp.]|nr:adenylate/guanylate cyclase domain-containing protein [Usitatibacter sp.]
MPGQTTGCVLFADVSGSTKLYDSVGDVAALSAIELCVRLFSALTEQHGGRVVKTIGDEIMAVFPAAPEAGRAAVDIQLGMHEMAPVDKVRLGVRIGMHQGPIMERDGDVFGDTVNLAARLTEMASSGQIITSLETVELLEPIQKMDCRSLYAIAVKGKEEEVRICEVVWTDTDDVTQLVAQRATTDQGKQLRVVYRSRVMVLDEERRSLVIGREATADLVVPDRMASRVHCEIERRQGKFVLTDRSANGTYLTIDGDQEIVLRREEAMLRHHGIIALGQSQSSATERVEFFCE